jgi:hypothetical protein
VTCPKCGRQGEPNKVGFTWWGGVVGPRLLSHVECPRCHARFNGNTGQSNEMAIRLYLAVVTIAVLVAAFVYFVGF